MKARRPSTALALAILTLAAAACSIVDTPQDDARLLSREDAIRVVRARLGVFDGQPVVVRLAPEPLQPGDVVREAFSTVGRTSMVPEWLVWVDQRPGAMHAHAGQYLYIDRRDGTAVAEPHDEVPLVNDRLVWSLPDDYANEDDIVFSSEIRLKDGRLALAEGPDGHAYLPPEYVVDPPTERRECCPEPRRRFGLILYNFDRGPLRQDISDNVNGMAAALRANGYTVPNFQSSTGSGDVQPGIYLGDRRGRGIAQLRRFVEDHGDAEDCCEELIIYYTGHGQTRKDDDGRDRFFFGLRADYRGPGDASAPGRRLFAEAFTQELAGLASCRVHVIIDACHSGGFIDPLFELSGVETVRVSCDATEKAYGRRFDALSGGRIPDPYGAAQGERGSEFTSGFVKGLNENAARRGPGAAPTPARQLIDIGFLEAIENDATRLAGLTNPTGITRTGSDCDCCDDGQNGSRL